MVTNINKGIYPIAIYEYIKTNSDDNSPLTIEQITKHMRKYSGEAKASSTKRMVLRHFNDLIQYDENIQVILKDSDKEYIPGEVSPYEIDSVYYDQPYSSSDIRILSDAVIYSKHIKKKNKERLLKTVASLRPSNINSNDWYRNAIYASSDMTQVQSDLYRNLEYIDQAIMEKKCLKFNLLTFDASQKLNKGISHKGFTPYTIYINNDTYYVVGVTLADKKRLENYYDKYPHSKFKTDYPVVRFEIFKMDKVGFDDEYEYLDIKKTPLKKRNTLLDICNSEFDTHHRLNKKDAFISTNVTLLSTGRGLQALIPTFGKRMQIKKATPDLIPPIIAQSNAEHEYNDKYYIIILKKARRQEWNELLSLLNQYPIHDIALLSHHDYLKKIISHLSDNLKLI